MGDAIRRVVTTNDQTGKAVILFDSLDPHKIVREQTGIVSRVIWVSDCTPANISVKEDPVKRPVGIGSPPNGSIFRIVDFPPLPPENELSPDLMQSLVGGAHAAQDANPPRHPMMHRTRSLDYAIVLSGEIDMLLDESTVHCKAGDVIIQQGTNHGWVNHGSETCRIAFVLIDAQEPSS